MAHMPAILPSSRGRKYGDQWNEKYEQTDFYFPGHHAPTDVLPPSLENDDFMNKSTHHRSDQNSISLKSNASNEKKCQVYVHQFSKIPSRSSSNYKQNNWQSGSEIHQNLYKHEFTDFYDTKIRTFKKQFDNLSLHSRKPQTSTPHKILKSHKNDYYYNQQTKIPSVISSPNAKINKALLFRPEHKAAVDKLEESYWAKWKPSKSSPAKEPRPKMKGLYTDKESYPKIKNLYTENESIKSPYHIISKKGKKERGDSSEAIMPQMPLEKHEMSDSNLIYVENAESDERQQEDELGKPSEENLSVTNGIQIQDEAVALDGVTPIAVTCESESECKVNGLKHTNSFILTAKKQSHEKPHFQQPKCIKLFKNAGYTTSTPTNYVKGAIRGGSYPLKSCLKRDSPPPKPCHLGRPGSPVRGSVTRRPGKANRFTG